MTEASSEQDKIDGKALTKPEEYWHNHYNCWQQSGLSLAAYARSLGLVVNTFYGWHARLKKRGLAKPELASTLFHRVILKPTEAPAVICEETTSLRFRLPNGIDCELRGIKPDKFTGWLETLACISFCADIDRRLVGKAHHSLSRTSASRNSAQFPRLIPSQFAIDAIGQFKRRVKTALLMTDI